MELTPLNYVAGEWRHGHAGQTVVLTNPATATSFACYKAADERDVDQALQATEQGFADWRARTALERSDILKRAAAGLREQAQAIAQLLTRE